MKTSISTAKNGYLKFNIRIEGIIYERVPKKYSEIQQGDSKMVRRLFTFLFILSILILSPVYVYAESAIDGVENVPINTGSLTLIFIFMIVLIIALVASVIYQSRVKEKEMAANLRFQALFDNMGEGFALHEIICDENEHPIDYKFLEVNRAFEEITGLKAEKIRNKTVKEVLPATESYWIEQYGEVALHGKNITFINYSGEIGKYFQVNVYSPKAKQFATIFTDITSMKELEKTLVAERKLFQTTLHSLGDGVISADRNGNVDLMNAVAERLTGWTISEAKGMPFDTVFNIVNEFTRIPCQNPIKLVFESGKTVALSNHTLLIKKNGEEIPIEDSAAPIKDDNGNTTGVVLVFRDFTEKKVKQEEITYLSYHDHLTGLYNRRFFEEELHRLDSDRNLPFTIVMIDVNGLKLTNDAFGHLAGDELLKRVAQVLRNECRSEDIISRIGGDEFVILLPLTNRASAESRIRSMYQAFEEESMDNIVISVSIGSDTKEAPSQNIRDIFMKAEENMYRKKITETQSMRNKTIQIILNTLNKKNAREKIHSENVSKLSVKIGKALNLNYETLKELEMSALMHDIGKIAINDDLLNKSCHLTEAEYDEVKRHSESGYHILKSVDSYSKLADYILAHHERWDGSGYPRELSGEAIPLVSRIICVADAFEAMTSDRPYRKRMSKDAAITELNKCAGKQFDPEIVKVIEVMWRQQETFH